MRRLSWCAMAWAAIAIGGIGGVGFYPASAQAPAPPPAPPAAATAPPLALVAARTVDDCIGDNNFVYRAGAQLVSVTSFIPAGRTAEFILKERFSPTATYYYKIEAPYARAQPFGGKDTVAVSAMPESSPYVASGIATKDDSLVRIQVPVQASGPWRSAMVHVYSCEAGNSGAPRINSSVATRISSNIWCTVIVTIVTILAYVAAAIAFRGPQNADVTDRWWRCFDPVVLTSGPDGRGSLAKLQILFFSLIVFALLLYLLMRTGQLSDLSNTILTLLGIAAVGSVASKATDNKQSRFSFDNWVWLIDKKWLQPGNVAAEQFARWSDLITSDGEFDVYRYQICIFTLIVGGALLFLGVYQLSSFVIPDALLGLLGLSQVVYVAGKLVSPTAIADADQAVAALRAMEQTLRAAAAAAGTPTSPALLSDVERYRTTARATATKFSSATGFHMPSNFEPNLG